MRQLCLICLLLIITFQLSAQQIETNSIRIRKTAIGDADNSFKLNGTIRKAFRHKQLYTTSDFFKPNLKTTKKPQLLNDSNYVEVLRKTAYNDTVYQIGLNRSKIVIIGAVVAGVIIIAVIVVKLAEAFGNAFSHLFDNII